MSKIGLVTCEAFREKATDDDMLVEEFTRRGYACDRPAWEDKTVDWKTYDALIIRSTWDYSDHLAEFLSWIERIKSLETTLYNPPMVIKWNSNKNYLRELETKGIKIPTTEWLSASEVKNAAVVGAAMDKHGWNKAVVKPIVGAGGYFTYCILREEVNTHKAFKQPELTQHGVMVQEFLPEITQAGEWSFLFFGNEFSHAVIKKPMSGEFRIQVQHGGTFEEIIAPQTLIKQAEQVLLLASEKLLYARVDGIVRNGEFILIELEVLEPWLYLTANENSKQRFVDAYEKLQISN